MDNNVQSALSHVKANALRKRITGDFRKNAASLTTFSGNSTEIPSPEPLKQMAKDFYAKETNTISLAKSNANSR